MNHWISKTAFAAAMVVASGASFAAGDGQFFVNGQVGSKKVSLSEKVKDVKNRDTIGSLRLGYMWNNGPLSYGAETGYVALGSENGILPAAIDGISPRIVGGGKKDDLAVRIKIGGWIFGGNTKFHFDDHWFVSARGGLFRSNVTVRTGGVSTGLSTSTKSTKNGYYAGVGAGYDFNEHFGLGVNFDYYRARANLGTGSTVGAGYKAYGLMGEYRF